MTKPDKKEVEDPKAAARRDNDDIIAALKVSPSDVPSPSQTGNEETLCALHNDRSTGSTMSTAVSLAITTRKRHNPLPEKQMTDEEKWPVGEAAKLVPQEQVRSSVDDIMESQEMFPTSAIREPASLAQSNEKIKSIPQLEPKTVKIQQLQQHQTVTKSAPVQENAEANKRHHIEASRTVGMAAPIPKQLPLLYPNVATKTGNNTKKDLRNSTSEPTSRLKEERGRMLAVKEVTRTSRVPDKKSGGGVLVGDGDNDYIRDSPWQELQERKNPRLRWARIWRQDLKSQCNRQDWAVSPAATSLNNDRGYHTTPIQSTDNAGRGPQEEDRNDEEAENELSSPLQQEYQQHGEVISAGLVVANAVTIPEVPSASVIGIAIRGGDDDNADEAREQVAELQHQKKNWQRIATFLLVTSISVAMVVVFVNNSTDTQDKGDDRIPFKTIPPSPSPTVTSMPSLSPLNSTSSSYETRGCFSYSSVVTFEHDASNFCGATLEENTAYVLAGGVACNQDEDGPTLSSNVCLDCGGNTIRRNVVSGGFVTFGIRIPSSATDVVIHNCVVENFYYGVLNIGGDAFISNVRSSENGSSGIDNIGGNTQIECSVINDNGNNGIYSTGRGSINITGCLMDSNDNDGVQLRSGNGVVSCSKILSNGEDGITISSSADRVIIRDTIVADSGDNNIEGWGGEPSVSLANVTACDAVDNDIDFRDGAFQFTSYDELTCDNGKLVPSSLDVTCTYPCPADFSSRELPETCPICPNGVGTYTP